MNSDKFAELQAQILQLNVSEKEKSSLLTTLGDLKHTKILRNPQYVLEDTVKLNKIKKVEKYDVVATMVMGIPHPAIVYKILDNKVLLICFTTNKNYLGNVIPITNSRFFENNYATATLQVVSQEDAVRHFKCVYGNKASADRIFAAFKRYYLNILK
jgi:hypothetical protein